MKLMEKYGVTLFDYNLLYFIFTLQAAAENIYFFFSQNKNV